MAGVYFYAVDTDFKPVMDIIFNAGCEVYESRSAVCAEVRQFRNTESVLAALGAERFGSLLLSAWHPDMQANVRFERIDFDPKYCGPNEFAYAVAGWGLLDIDMDEVNHDSKYIRCSCLIHNSEKRALAWEELSPQLGNVSAWNWAAVEKISRSISKQIRKLSKERELGRCILPAAASLHANGYELA